MTSGDTLDTPHKPPVTADTTAMYYTFYLSDPAAEEVVAAFDTTSRVVLICLPPISITLWDNAKFIKAAMLFSCVALSSMTLWNKRPMSRLHPHSGGTSSQRPLISTTLFQPWRHRFDWQVERQSCTGRVHASELLIFSDIFDKQKETRHISCDNKAASSYRESIIRGIKR